MDLIQLSNWSEAAAVMAESWKQNRELPLNYTAEFIETLVNYPCVLPPIAPALIEGTRLAAFVMGFPRTFILNGQARQFLLMTFFTVNAEYKGRGLGKRIWAECVRQTREQGYHGTLHYCVDGNISNTVTVSGARMAGFDARPILKISHLMRFLRKTDEGTIERSPVEVADFLALAASLKSIALRRQWTQSEAEWQLGRPCALSTGNKEAGVIAGYQINNTDAQQTSVLMIEDILWGSDSEQQRAELLSAFLARAAQVASLAVVPVLGYADLKPFLEAGFRRSPRALSAYLTCFDGSELEPPASIYADVI